MEKSKNQYKYIRLASVAIALAYMPQTIAQTPPKWQVIYNGAVVPENGTTMAILDPYECKKTDVAKFSYPIAYFSAHYEDWRPDAKFFGRKLGKISGWSGERYIDWTDPKNQKVMLDRIWVAKNMGFKGIDWDNVDGPFSGKGKAHSDKLKYLEWLIAETNEEGLTAGLKNYVEALPVVGGKVGFFVSEATTLSELTCYRKYVLGDDGKIKRPAVRMMNKRRKSFGWAGESVTTPSFMWEARSGVDGNRF